MCCRVTTHDLILPMLIAALIALALTWPRYRYRWVAAIGWLLVPTWLGFAVAGIITHLSDPRSGALMGSLFVMLVQPMWAGAGIVGVLLGAALRKIRMWRHG